MHVRWSRAFSVGLADVDEQHRALFARLAEFHEAVARNEDVTRTSQLFETFRTEVVSHFRAEEALMADGYSDHLLHKEAHDAFLADLGVLRGAIVTAAGAEVLARVVDWLQAHVAGADRELGSYLRRRSAP